MSSTVSTSTGPTPTAKLPRYVVVSAWAVPLLIVGQFALLALVPVVLVVIGVWRNSRSKRLRWSAAALAASYATPLAIWALREDGAQSLSKDLNPILAGVIVVASAAVLVTIRVSRSSARSR